MVRFAKAYAPPKLISLYSQLVIWLLVLLLLSMAVAQLADLQNFIAILQTYQLPNNEASSLVVAAILVISEVFALPFLLRMTLSRLMRWFSLLCGWLAVLIWLGLVWWALSNYLAPANVGYFGEFVNWPLGTVALLYGAILTVLMALASRLLRHDFGRKRD